MKPTPGWAFPAIVATLAYLGLAVLGWGGFAAFFSHPTRTPSRRPPGAVRRGAVFRREPEPRRARGPRQPLDF
ncbi:hypothetical protein, partial [Methylomagnum ishizawai]|uniref:hypothetical protein n=1 Tax=Methylomagnum ishizawai TaxID=1760988 RepID=UPI0020CAC86C